MPRTNLVITTLLGVILLAGCLNVVEPIQREYHVDTVVQPGEIYTKKVQVDDPSERVVPTICYKITTNHSADIYVFNTSESFATYQTTLVENQNVSDLHQRLSKRWRPLYFFGIDRHIDTHIPDGLKSGTYYFTVENTAFQTSLEQKSRVKPMKLDLDLYVANKECP